jgi:hypothetical protein
MEYDDPEISPGKAAALLALCAVIGLGLVAVWLLTSTRSSEIYHDVNGTPLDIRPGQGIDLDLTGKVYRPSRVPMPPPPQPPRTPEAPQPPTSYWKPTAPLSQPAPSPIPASSDAPATRPD